MNHELQHMQWVMLGVLGVLVIACGLLLLAVWLCLHLSQLLERVRATVGRFTTETRRHREELCGPTQTPMTATTKNHNGTIAAQQRTTISRHSVPSVMALVNTISPEPPVAAAMAPAGSNSVPPCLISVDRIQGDNVKLAFEAPKSTNIVREELLPEKSSVLSSQSSAREAVTHGA